jgi:hypothetical protein
MANEKVGITISVDSGNASKSIDDLGNKIDNAGKSAKTAGKEAKQAAGAFGSIGNAIKTLGIINVINKGFEFFQQVLGKNQKVADLLSTSMNFLTGVFSDLVSFFVDNTGKVVDFFKEIFENPKQLVADLATAIKNNLIERLNSAIEALGLLGQTLKNLLTGDFDAAAESAKLFGKEMLDVATGVDDAFDKTSKALGDLTEAAGDYFSKKLEQAKALTKATNDAVLAEARQLNTIKQTEIAAEKLRQQRDNEALAIQDRIKANNELGEVLKRGQQQELALIGIRQQKIQNEIALNGVNKELQAELIRLEGERADIQEKYTAFASEQLVNQNSLLREQIDINKSISESNNKIALDQRKASAELIFNEIERLEAKREIFEEEAELELIRLQTNINNTKAGTAARAEAEIAFAQKKSEIEIQIAASDNEIQTKKIEKETEFYTKLKELYQSDRDAFLELQDAKFNIATQGLNALSSLVGENEKLANIIFAIQKAIEIGKIFTSTSSAITQVAAQTASIPAILPPGIPNPAFAIASAIGAKKIAGLKINAAAQIAGIVGSTISKFKSGSSASPKTPSTEGGGAAPISPNSLFQTASVTRLDQQSINQLGSATNRAYVVESDITNQQEKIVRINRAARLA